MAALVLRLFEQPDIPKKVQNAGSTLDWLAHRGGQNFGRLNVAGEPKGSINRHC